MGDFDGKAVIVTGGGTGIGRATARSFAAQGADVLVVGRTAARLDETADGAGIRTLVADIAEPGAADHIVDTAVGTFGRLDVLVNNAAILKQDDNRAGVEEMLATNLLAPLYLTQAATPHVSVVINVTTSIGQRGWPVPGGTVYGAAKMALESLTRSWAVHLAPKGIRVAAVAPGPIDTPMPEHQGLRPAEVDALRDKMVGYVPLGRIGRPEEVAFWIVQLARPEAAFTSGVVLPVDGAAVVG
ncbi:SDR family NAD(P)-dependent oxidoreductase [Kibdelosporangium phytohabitans]|uniref:Ketoreductase n=1 Tax=Kibdelosporangium phytohabitans TaxID=860235 RepID=A0A0N9HND2_9PSEU|nr:SDR family oxidoreductase [Kibdelosporangium phytohabitans]ALG05633.1 ketoreductase [Kibdelosporangium phytohabitans]MBE1466391.1 NAD(P)-dependent dehydrogenase (short-subunit alcohol dehydrogenase family) [Kibdelosporangium phytohabitans]